MNKSKTIINKYVLAVLIFNFIISMISVFINNPNFYDHADETTCHYEVIKLFAGQFPHIDIADYNSATGPFYHIFMATISNVASVNLYFLRTVNVLICILLLILMAYFYKMQNSDIKNKYLAMNLLFLSTSVYFLGPEVRLSTDNFALLFVMISVILMKKSMDNPKYIIPNAFVIFLAAFTRQNCFWLGIPQAIILLTNKKIKIGKKLIYCGVLGIPILLYIPVFLLWGGLIPPRYADRHMNAALNIEVFYYLLAVIGFFSVIYWKSFLNLMKSSGIKILEIVLSAAVAIALLIIYPLSYKWDPTMQGGVLWNVSTRIPQVFGTSILFYGLIFIGILFLYTLIKTNIIKKIYLFDSMLLFPWMILMLKNNMVYQKYYEPMIIILLGSIFSHYDEKIEKQYITSAIYILASVLIAVTRFII